MSSDKLAKEMLPHTCISNRKIKVTPPKRTEQQISEIMRRVKSRDTTPELAFRRALHARGVRYRLHVASLPGKPDIVIRKARLLIFIDGDFWHGNQWRTRGHASLDAQFVASPKAEYWVGKIGGNVRRDKENTIRALVEGWRVLRFWESDIRKNLADCLETTLRAIATQTDDIPIDTIADICEHGKTLRPLADPPSL